jgi:hypothetical protein
MLFLLTPDHHEAHGGGEDLSTMPFAYVQLAILVVVAVFEAVVFVLNSQRRVNAFQFASQIRKLVDANNVERAFKLCAAAPNAYAVRLAKIGLEARARNASMRDAMHAELPSLLASARAFLLPAVAIGALACAEGVVLLVRGVEGQATGEFDGEVLGPLILLALATAANAARWGAWRRDLDEVVTVLSKA